MVKRLGVKMQSASIRQGGVSLIEVLVSVTVLSLGLVGMAALQARSMMMNQSSHYRSVAADLANDLADRIRANRSPFLASPGSTAIPETPPDFSKCTASIVSATITSTCTPAQSPSYRVTQEMVEWYGALIAQLPGATYGLTSTAITMLVAGVTTTTGYRYSLTITWLDDRSATGTAVSTSYAAVIE